MLRFYYFLISSLLIAFFIVLFFRPITSINEDLGRHLLIGGIIAKNHSVPKTNLLTYTYRNYEFVNTTWLSALIFHKVYQLGGFNLLLLGSVVIVVLGCTIQISYVRKKFSVPAILIASTFYLSLLSSRTDVRPEIFSMLVLSLFIVILYGFSEKVEKKIFFLIPLQLVWVNLHIYFFTGPLLVFLYLIGEIKNGITKNKKFKFLSLVLVGTILACFINPNGFKGAIFPLIVSSNYGFNVIENQNIFLLANLYQNLSIYLPFFVILILIAILLINKKRVKLFELLLVLVFSLSALFVFRNVLLFIFSTFIIFVKYIDLLFKKYLPFFKKLPQKPFYFMYPLSLLVLILFIFKSIEINSVGFGIDEKGKGALDFIKENNIKGPYFNNFDIGGYLSYRIYPELTYVDNRPEAFPKEFFLKIYSPMQKDPEIFKTESKNYKFNVLVVKHWDESPWKDALLKYLVNRSDFKMVYLDQYIVVFLKNTKENQKLTSKSINIYNLNIRSRSNDAKTLIGYLFFFEKVGKDKEAIGVFDLLKRRDPELCSLKKYTLVLKKTVSFISGQELKNICPRSGINLFNLL